jgi:hypothetical protein
MKGASHGQISGFATEIAENRPLAGLDDCQERDVLWVTIQQNAAGNSPVRVENASSYQMANDLRQIGRGFA